jgi:lysozyme
MIDNCLLVDVSLYQPNMDYVELAENNVRGVIAKASQGSYRRDPFFTRHVEKAKKAGMAVGAYHWLDPNSDDITQAKYFLQTVEDQPVSFLAVDMEQYWKYWYEWYKKEIRNVIPAERISENGYRVASFLKKNSGLPVVVYTRASFVSYRTPPASEWLPNFNLWLAYYPYSRVKVTTTWDDLMINYLPRLKGPLLPKNCEQWLFWQFSGDKFRLNGTNGSAIDLNFFNGDADEFNNFITTGNPPKPVIKPTLPGKARIIYRINLRSEPRVAAETLVGKLNTGTIVDVLETRNVGADVWARIGNNRWAAMLYRNMRLMAWVT